MAILAWTMMGIALWHFAVYLPDRFWGGIVGAFFAAIIGAVAFSFAVNGFDIPSRADTEIIQAFIAVPGSIIGLAVCYFAGIRQEAEASQ